MLLACLPHRTVERCLLRGTRFEDDGALVWTWGTCEKKGLIAVHNACKCVPNTTVTGALLIQPQRAMYKRWSHAHLCTARCYASIFIEFLSNTTSGTRLHQVLIVLLKTPSLQTVRPWLTKNRHSSQIQKPLVRRAANPPPCFQKRLAANYSGFKIRH